MLVNVFGWARNDYHVNIDGETCGFTKTVISPFNNPVIVDKTLGEIFVGDYSII